MKEMQLRRKPAAALDPSHFALIHPGNPCPAEEGRERAAWWAAGSQPGSARPHPANRRMSRMNTRQARCFPKARVVSWLISMGSLQAVPPMRGAGARRQPRARRLASLFPSACSSEHHGGVRGKPCAPRQAARCPRAGLPGAFLGIAMARNSKPAFGFSGLSPYSILVNEIISSSQQEQSLSPGKPPF